MDFPVVLTQFGDAIGLTELKLDADNCCTLLFDAAEAITFTLNEEDNAVLLHSELMPASVLRSREALAELMQASLLGAKTGGAAFSVHDELDRIVLWKRYDNAFSDVTALEKAVNGFLAQVVFWKEHLSEGAARDELKKELSADKFAFQGLLV